MQRSVSIISEFANSIELTLIQKVDHSGACQEPIINLPMGEQWYTNAGVCVNERCLTQLRSQSATHVQGQSAAIEQASEYSPRIFGSLLDVRPTRARIFAANMDACDK